MRTKNEKLLLIVLAAIVFVGLNYFGYRWLAQKQSSLKMEEAELRADEAEAKLSLQQTNTWAQRKEWIATHQPVMGDEGETKAAVLDHVKKGAQDNKLEILDQSLGEVERGAGGTRLNASIKVKGSMQDVCKWLTDLEKPEEFYAVSSFSLSADQDQKSMVCTVQIARYFKGSGS